MRPVRAALIVLLAAMPLWAGEEAVPLVHADNYAQLRDALAPTEAEQAWRAVGWRTSFAQAVVEARASGRPVFLWAMNGHPLGCT